MRHPGVEDQPQIAGFIQSGLEEAGFVVTLCRTGEEGLDLATTESFDAMLLDIMLPGAGGVPAAARLSSMDMRFFLLSVISAPKSSE